MQPWQVFGRFWEMVKHAKAVVLSPATPWYVKVILVSGVLYILSPYDFIPEWIPVIGVMDDFALAALLLAWANSFTLSK